MSETDQDVTRYNLILPAEQFRELRAAARRNGLTVSSILRRFIKLGMYLIATQARNPDAEIIVKEGDKETRLLIL